MHITDLLSFNALSNLLKLRRCPPQTIRQGAEARRYAYNGIHSPLQHAIVPNSLAQNVIYGMGCWTFQHSVQTNFNCNLVLASFDGSLKSLVKPHWPSYIGTLVIVASILIRCELPDINTRYSEMCLGRVRVLDDQQLAMETDVVSELRYDTCRDSLFRVTTKRQLTFPCLRDTYCVRIARP